MIHHLCLYENIVVNVRDNLVSYRRVGEWIATYRPSTSTTLPPMTMLSHDKWLALVKAVGLLCCFLAKYLFDCCHMCGCMK
jgi:hypothetical protein